MSSNVTAVSYGLKLSLPDVQRLRSLLTAAGLSVGAETRTGDARFDGEVVVTGATPSALGWLGAHERRAARSAVAKGAVLVHQRGSQLVADPHDFADRAFELKPPFNECAAKKVQAWVSEIGHQRRVLDDNRDAGVSPQFDFIAIPKLESQW